MHARVNNRNPFLEEIDLSLRMTNDTEYSLDESLASRALRFDDDAEMRSNEPPSVQLATLSQKKRLWWRNAIINALFIGSWCAGHGLDFKCSPTSFYAL